jgi:hypothetical protein
VTGLARERVRVQHGWRFQDDSSSKSLNAAQEVTKRCRVELESLLDHDSMKTLWRYSLKLRNLALRGHYGTVFVMHHDMTRTGFKKYVGDNSVL